MAKTQYVTIPLDEYKELLLREKPTDKSHELCQRILSIVRDAVEYDENDRSYYSNNIGNHLKVNDGDKCVVEIMRMLKYVDFDWYMEIWNSVMTGKRNADAMEAKIAQMNEAKQIRSES